MEFRKNKTNPRNIITQELIPDLMNGDYVQWEIGGFENNLIHEWRIVKTVRGDRPFVMKVHVVRNSERGNVVVNEGGMFEPFDRVSQGLLNSLNSEIINNYNMIITYIHDHDGERLRYNCRTQGGLPSPRCYDNLANPARKIASKVKSALASPYTELGRRRIRSDYSDLVDNYPQFFTNFGFGGNKRKYANKHADEHTNKLKRTTGGSLSKINGIINYLNTL